MPLDNFRTNPFVFFGQKVLIGGMAGPHNNPDGIIAALTELKYSHKMDVLIGLHDRQNFTEEAHKVGLKYHHIPVTDFAEEPVSPEIYDKIYEVICDSIQKGKKVTIHCGAGNGRTGTALAALKLRELIEKAALQNPDILDEKPEVNTVIWSPHLGRDLPCSPLVKQAILKIREERSQVNNNNGTHSVETLNDINTLINYESHLKKLLKENKNNKLSKIPFQKKVAENSQPTEVISELSKKNEIAEMQYQSFAEKIFGNCLYAGSHPFPDDKPFNFLNLTLLKDLGITKIYSLEEKNSNKIKSSWEAYAPLFCHITGQDYVSYFIQDFSAPSQEQLNKIVDDIQTSIDKNEKIYLHCKGGNGRTGTILAAIYMKKNNVTAAEAILYVRDHYSPFAIETLEQEEALFTFAHINKLGNLENSFLTQKNKLKDIIQKTDNQNIKQAATNVLTDLNNSKASLSTKDTILFKTISLMQSYPYTDPHRIGSYKQCANDMYKGDKILGCSMLGLAVVLSVILLIFVSVSTFGLAAPPAIALASAGGTSLLSSFSIFGASNGKRLQSQSMNNLITVLEEELPTPQLNNE